jgi:Cu-Zn family superoxide dismutase
MNKEKLTVRYSNIAFISAAVALAALSGCSYLPTQLPGQQQAVKATLEPRSGSQVNGKVSFTPVGDKLLVEAYVTGLTPGEHGFHVHEGGDCSAADASGAKGHFNPAGMPHGHHHQMHYTQRHAGDLPNLVADSSGQAYYRAEVTGLKVDGSARGLVGRSVIVHADADDYQSQPAGNSGRRVACGVIKAP